MGGLTIIADTNGPFADFAPYVASINDRGTIAFQAARLDGRTGLYVGDGGPVACVDASAAYRSHPDIDEAGVLAAYADLDSGAQAVQVVRNGATRAVAKTGDVLEAIGPLGPTMNDAGAVAFRADTVGGAHGIFVAARDGMAIETIAATGEHFSAFQGLPCLARSGSVTFRADRLGGGEGIYVWRGGEVVPVVETGGTFVGLGRFPAANDAGAVVFVAIRRDGGAGVFRAADGGVEPVIDAAAGFESFRGALVDNRGRIVFYATPRGGTLGVYGLEPGGVRRITGLGDAVLAGTVTDFALNPVSLNNTGQLALRLALADGRQVIARADAFAP